MGGGPDTHPDTPILVRLAHVPVGRAPAGGIKAGFLAEVTLGLGLERWTRFVPWTHGRDFSTRGTALAKMWTWGGERVSGGRWGDLGD